MGKYLLSKVYNLYVASAVNAEHAETADTASNALKLGGYDASDYLRKDEVQNTISTYTETEWQTAGTYYFVVPEGVNKLYVTTVGGGGGVGFNYFVANNGSYSFNFSGGQGGEVHFDYVNVTPGETITVVVGAKGKNPNISNFPIYLSDFQREKGKDGGSGGDSYLARSNGQKITSTVARGGNGGSGKLVYNPKYLTQSMIIQGMAAYPVYYCYGGGQINNDIRYGGGKGAVLAIQLSTGYNNSNNGSEAGYSGKQSVSTRYNKTSTTLYGPAGVYNYVAAGGSWGDACDPVNLVNAGIGGGGCAGAIHGGNGFRLAGDGYVNIKAIGTVYDL